MEVDKAEAVTGVKNARNRPEFMPRDYESL